MSKLLRALNTMLLLLLIVGNSVLFVGGIFNDNAVMAVMGLIAMQVSAWLIYKNEGEKDGK